MADIGMHKTHPVIVVAATAVILTCLLAVGVMTGIVPSPMSKGTATQQELANAPVRTTPAVPPAAGTRENHAVSRAPAHEPRHEVAERPAAPRAPVGMTNPVAPSNTVAGSYPAPAPVCTTCGTVSSVHAVREQGTASMIGPAAGGLIGGLAGHQIGGGTGKTIATIAGAAVGAGVGTEVERRTKSTTHYVVSVQMNDGTTRSVNYEAAPGVEAGDKVRVADGRLIRQ
jgi:outer membrane lipoprotein SlyB